MGIFSKMKLDTAPASLRQVELPVKYSDLTNQNRFMVRRRYIELQDGKCWHCGYDLEHEPAPHIANIRIRDPRMFPDTFFDYPVHLHHDHLTDDTIGAVHAQCNAVLWQDHGV